MANFKLYSIQNAFPNHKENTDRLTLEIRASAITVALDYITTAGDDCTIYFKADLSTDNVTILDSVVAAHSGEPLPVGPSDVNIASSVVTLASQEKGFQDLSGRNVYRFGPLHYLAEAGEVNIWMEKFSATMYIQGGGVSLPEYTYQSGVKTDNKPEDGDWCSFDLVDVDAVTPYGKKATISKVARASNVSTLTTSAAHTFAQGDLVCVNANDDTFDDMEVAIASVPDNTHITYANPGDDVTEKDATGTFGKIVVLAPFVPKDYLFPGQMWQCVFNDAKSFPAGIYLRFRYVSTGSTNVLAFPHYSLRT